MSKGRHETRKLSWTTNTKGKFMLHLKVFSNCQEKKDLNNED